MVEQKYSIIPTVHGLLVVKCSTVVECNDFLWGNLDMSKVLFQSILQEVLMGDLGVNTKKVSDHSSDIITESVGFDKDFLRSKPIDNWRINLCKLDGFNSLGTAKKATDSYNPELTRLCWGWGVNEEIHFETLF